MTSFQGNTGDGFYIDSSGTTGNLVEGDYIGTGAAGSSSVPNFDGVYIGAGASDNTIGGATAGTRDVISGNDWEGVHLEDTGTASNVVEGDYIGTNASGSAAVGNAESGVGIYSGKATTPSAARSAGPAT